MTHSLVPRFPRRGLYALTADMLIDDAGLVAAIVGAIAGGAVVVQYRDKHAEPTRRLARAGALVAACHARGVPLIVNDEVDLAVAVGAAGVHLGRDDGTIAAARARLGAERIIGVSCYDSLARAADAVAAGADYIAFGSFYASSTKPRAVRCDLAVLSRAAQLFATPIVAIGGITPENAATLIAAGADLVAVIGAIFDHPNTTAAARAFAPLF